MFRGLHDAGATKKVFLIGHQREHGQPLTPDTDIDHVRVGHRFRGKKARLEKRRTHCRASTQGDGPIIHQALGGGGFGFVEGVANLSLGHDRGQDQSDRPLVETPGRAEPGLQAAFR